MLLIAGCCLQELLVGPPHSRALSFCPSKPAGSTALCSGHSGIPSFHSQFALPTGPKPLLLTMTITVAGLNEKAKASRMYQSILNAGLGSSPFQMNILVGLE